MRNNEKYDFILAYAEIVNIPGEWAELAFLDIMIKWIRISRDCLCAGIPRES
jgi:hypothetical protein